MFGIVFSILAGITVVFCGWDKVTFIHKTDQETLTAPIPDDLEPGDLVFTKTVLFVVLVGCMMIPIIIIFIWYVICICQILMIDTIYE